MFSDYQINHDGTVYSHKTKKFLKPLKTRDGYFQIALDGVRHYIHVLVAKEHIPNPQNKKEVNHKDLNKANNHYLNLEWVSRRENMVHASKAGVCYKRNGIDLLAFVKDIQDEYNRGDLSQGAIGKKYGVSSTTIWRIINGRTYKQI